MLVEKYGLDPERLHQGMQLRYMYKTMANNFKVEAGSLWYLLSTKWVRHWHQWIYLDLLTGVNKEQPPSTDLQRPEPISWDDIRAPFNSELILADSDNIWESAELKPGLREGIDFSLVTPWIYNLAESTFGRIGRPMVRYGI